MKRRLSAYLERIAASTSLAGLQASVFDLRDYFGIDHIVYATHLPEGSYCAAASYPKAWIDRYAARDYRRIDPVIGGCQTRFAPFDWKELDWSAKPARTLLHEARALGVGNQGLSMPVRGPQGQFAIFTLNHQTQDAAWAHFAQAHADDMVLSAHHVNRKALELTGQTGSAAAGLSPRESDVLAMLALGYNRARAAEALAISEHTLRVYLENARQKLGAMTTTQAVARATSQGLISV